MAALSVCTKEEQPSVIRFLWSEGVSGVWTIKKWSHKCYAWQRSRTTIYGHHWGQHWACMWHGLLDRQVTIGEVAHVLQISHDSAYEMTHNKLGFHKVCPRWVPKQLSDMYKQTRVDVCQKYLNRYGNERDIFVDRIITVTKHGSIITSRRVNGRVWNGKIPQSPCKKKFKTQSSAGKLMLTVF